MNYKKTSRKNIIKGLLKASTATLALTGILAIAGCNQAKSGDDTMLLGAGLITLMNQSVSGSVSFQVTAGGSAISCSTPPATGVTIANVTDDDSTHDIEVQDMRFFISNIKLIGASGNEVAVTLESNEFQDPTSGVVLLDFEDATGSCTNGESDTHTSIQMSYPSGEYTGIKFDVGVPDSYNRLYNAAAPSGTTPQVFRKSAMYWSWASAYKFGRFEFKDTGTLSSGAAVFHLGSMGDGGTSFSACDDATPVETYSVSGITNPCTYQNRPTISLTGTDFNPQNNQVVLDVVNLFSGSTSFGASCMSQRNTTTTPSTLHTNCTDLFAEIGVSGTDGSSTNAQTAFSLQ